MSNRKIYREVAKKNGVSVAEVKREMQAAINDAFQNPKNNSIIKAYQQQVPSKGEIPTADEVIKYVTSKVKDKN